MNSRNYSRPIGTDVLTKRFWTIWKEADQNDQEKYLHQLVNQVLAEDLKTRLFAERDERQRNTWKKLMLFHSKITRGSAIALAIVLSATLPGLLVLPR